VAAVNGVGPETPSKPPKAQKAEVSMYPADGPDRPKFENITKDSITLSWEKPANAGGSKITDYVVKK